MGNPNPKHKWKPGQSGNPKGKLPDPPELKAMKNLNRLEFETLVNRLLKMGPEDLIALKTTKGVSMLERMIASVIAKCEESGDYKSLNFFCDRLMGKVPERIEGANGEPVSFVALMKLAINE